MQSLSKHSCRVGITRLRLVNPGGEVTNQKAPLLKTACHAELVEACLPHWDYSASPREPRRGGYKPKSPGSLQRHVMQRLSKHGCRVGITRLRLVNPEGEASNQKPWLFEAVCHAEPVEAWLLRWDYSASPREPRRGGFKPKSPGSFVARSFFRIRPLELRSDFRIRKKPRNSGLFGLRRERDSNPRRFNPQRFSRPPHSTALPSLHNWTCQTGLQK